MSTNNKPAASFWIISIVALLWNFMGVFQFLLGTVLKDQLAAVSTEAELALINSLPSWYNIVFGIAVIAGVLGCLLLLMRKKLATPIFGISLIAVLVQMGYWIFVTDVIAVLGLKSVIMPLIVIAVAIVLYFYSKGASEKGWLR